MSFSPEGILPALPTATNDDGSINYEAQENHIEFLEDSGVHGIVPAGCTGHAASLGDHSGEELLNEHVEFVSRVSEMTDPDVAVIPGTGMNTTSQTLELAQQVEEEADIDAHLMISPYQNGPPQDRIVSHYEELAGSLERPIIAYNVPGRTGVNIEPRTVEFLAEIDGIVGLKEASNDPEQIREIGRRLDQGSYSFELGSGDDPRNHLIFEEGGSFAISVSGNVYPEALVEVWEAGYLDGDHQRAEQLNAELMEIHEAMFQEGEKNPISVQYFLNEMGFEFGTPRAPIDRLPHEGYDPITDRNYSNRSKIEEIIDRYNLEPEAEEVAVG